MIIKKNNKIDFLCPICGSDNIKEIYPDTLGNNTPSFSYDFNMNSNRTWRIVKCKQCSHHYATPRPKNLWNKYEEIEDKAYLIIQMQRIETAHKVLRIISKFCKNGTLLDIGCSTGDFLSVASEFYKVEGLELSKWAIKIATEKGFYVHNCRIEDMPHKEYFDIITLWGVIEHFENPEIEIKNIYRILKKKGIICIWTGNINSVISKLLGKKWWYIQGQHIQLFTRKSIIKLFINNGFEKIYMGKYPYVLTKESLINSLKRYPFISAICKPFLSGNLFNNIKFTLKLHGEIFAIFRKI